jgi:hypothetical protein
LILDHLRADGIAEDWLARVRAPVGLDLGGTTPAEIALAILAEIELARHAVAAFFAENEGKRVVRAAIFGAISARCRRRAAGNARAHFRVSGGKFDDAMVRGRADRRADSGAGAFQLVAGVRPDADFLRAAQCGVARRAHRRGQFFELAVAITLFGPTSGAALATVVGVLVEVPVMLSVCAVCNRSRKWCQRGVAEKLLVVRDFDGAAADKFADDGVAGD